MKIMDVSIMTTNKAVDKGSGIEEDGPQKQVFYDPSNDLDK